MLLQLPFYGDRRIPDRQVSYALPTVHTAAQQGAAAIKENHAIVSWLVNEMKFKGNENTLTPC